MLKLIISEKRTEKFNSFQEITLTMMYYTDIILNTMYIILALYLALTRIFLW